LSTALLIAIALGSAPAGAGEHLLAGATAFREGRFAEALVEFRVAERLGSEEARTYAGAVLVKLERHEEAIEAFGPAPVAGEDALISYYRAVALRAERLLISADRVLASIGDRSGPRISAEVSRQRAEIAAALARGASATVIDAVLARGAALRARGRLALAAAHYHEAAALAARRPDRHRLDEAVRASSEVGALAAGRRP
jgi:tetratricopeptide (TPR) repeat protein